MHHSVQGQVQPVPCTSQYTYHRVQLPGSPTPALSYYAPVQHSPFPGPTVLQPSGATPKKPYLTSGLTFPQSFHGCLWTLWLTWPGPPPSQLCTPAGAVVWLGLPPNNLYLAYSQVQFSHMLAGAMAQLAQPALVCPQLSQLCDLKKYI